jgi:MoaA/NifB/PqqE/SkfB family radical SAM enzyme
MNYSWLKHIEINIGKACNNKCIFCLSWNTIFKWNIALVEYTIIKDKLDWYYKKWYRSIGFLWWDISIHPDLYKIIKYCKKLWYTEIHVITNAMIFDDYNKAEKLILSWVTRVNISVHSHLEKIEDYLIQVPWGLKRKLKALDNFNNLYNKSLLKSSLSINIVLNKQNYKTIVETVLFYKIKKNINDIRINFIWLVENLSSNWWNIQISYTEILPYLKRLIYVSEKYNIRLTFDSIPVCIFLKINNKKGEYYLNKYFWDKFDHINVIDELSNPDLENTFYNKQDKEKNSYKTKFKDCKKCIYNNTCQWVWNSYYKVYWDKEFTPIINN